MQSIGSEASAVAVAALPVTSEGCAQAAAPEAAIPRATLGNEQSAGFAARAVAVAALPVSGPAKAVAVTVPFTSSAVAGLDFNMPMFPPAFRNRLGVEVTAALAAVENDTVPLYDHVEPATVRMSGPGMNRNTSVPFGFTTTVDPDNSRCPPPEAPACTKSELPFPPSAILCQMADVADF